MMMQEQVSLYIIDPSRAHEVVEVILGTDYAGVLVSDCFLAYDPLYYFSWQAQNGNVQHGKGKVWQ